MEKKQVKVPGYLIAIIITVLLSGIFLFAVMTPFLQQKPDYDEKHESAEKEKASLNPYVEDRSNIQASINKLQVDYNKKNKVLFENALKSADDVTEILKEFNIRFGGLDSSGASDDDSGVTTVEGGALKSSTVTFTFKATEAEYKSVLDYIEIRAPRTYYIDQIHFGSTDVIKDEEGNPIEVSGDEERKNYTLTLSLYYFENATGVSDEEDEEASGEQAEGSTDASTDASTVSAA